MSKGENRKSQGQGSDSEQMVDVQTALLRTVLFPSREMGSHWKTSEQTLSDSCSERSDWLLGWNELQGARAEAQEPIRMLFKLPRGEMKVARTRKCQWSAKGYRAVKVSARWS